jgi:hypothetical protein
LTNGHLQEAYQVAAGMTTVQQEEAVRAIVLKLAAYGDDDRALRTIDALGEHDFQKAALRAILIEALFEAGAPQRAKAVFDRCPASDVSSVLPRYVAGLVGCDQVDLALRLSHAADDGYTRGAALTEVAYALHRRGHSRTVQTAWEALAELELQRVLNDSLIRLRILAGQPTEAARAALDRRSDPFISLPEIVALLMDVGADESATAVADSINDQYKQFDTRAALITAWVRRGALESALTYTRQLSSRFDQSRLEAVIVRALLDAAEPSVDRAVGIAAAIGEENCRATALADCASRLLAAGESKRSKQLLALLDGIKDGTAQVRALQSIVQQPLPVEILQIVTTFVRTRPNLRNEAELLATTAAAWQRAGHFAVGLELLNAALDAAGRSELATYRVIDSAACILGAIDGGSTLLELYDHVVDLDSW